jgi:hypothetical protein
VTPLQYGFIDGGAVPGGYYDFCTLRAHIHAAMHFLAWPRVVGVGCVYKPWKGEALPQLLSAKLAALINSTEMLTFVKRRYSFGTWTLPDPCAAPTGECSDNSGRCSGCEHCRDLRSVCGAIARPCAVAISHRAAFRCLAHAGLKSPCGAGGKGKCLLDMKDYGVKFVPDNTAGPGKCIPGKGRFPSLHGQNVDAGDGANPFVERMFKSFMKNLTTDTPSSVLKIDDDEAVSAHVRFTL